MVYFDVAVRYVRQTGDEELIMVVRNLVDRGVRHWNLQVRCRSAYQLMKIIEAVEVKATGSAAVFLPLLISLEGERMFKLLPLIERWPEIPMKS